MKEKNVKTYMTTQRLTPNSFFLSLQSGIDL